MSSTINRCLDVCHVLGFHDLADRAAEILEEDTMRYDDAVRERNALRTELARVNGAIRVIVTQANYGCTERKEHAGKPSP